jgi:nucleoside-diphosphate-sugar epimerase
MIDGRTYNAGDQNLSVAAIAEAARAVVGGDVRIETAATDDHRSYRITSTRLAKELGFIPSHSITDAITELTAAFRAGRVPDPLTNDRYYNVRRMQRLALR